MALRGIVPDCADSYQQALEGAVSKKRRPGSGPGRGFSAAFPPLSPPGLLEFLFRGHSLLGSTRHEGRQCLLLPSSDLPGDLGASSQMPPQHLPSNLGGDSGRQSSCLGGGLCMGRGSYPPKAFCLYSQSSPRSPRPMTANCSGRPMLALSSNFRLASAASLSDRSLLSVPTSSGPCFQPSLRFRWQLWLFPVPEKIGDTGCPPPSLSLGGVGMILGTLSNSEGRCGLLRQTSVVRSPTPGPVSHVAF